MRKVLSLSDQNEFHRFVNTKLKLVIDNSYPKEYYKVIVYKMMGCSIKLVLF